MMAVKMSDFEVHWQEDRYQECDRCAVQPPTSPLRWQERPKNNVE